MSDIALKSIAIPAPIPVRELLPWAIFGGLMLMLGLYFVGAGQNMLGHEMLTHEFFHDGRHLLGFPCH
jgi:Probable cobalt transporter subunit (CbtB)